MIFDIVIGRVHYQEHNAKTLYYFKSDMQDYCSNFPYDLFNTD